MYAVLLPLLLSLGAEAAPPDIVVVCPQEFREAMQPWVDRRTKQGHNVEFISNLGAPVEIQQKIRTIAKQGKLQYVVLVGDAPKSKGDPAKRALLTPTFRIPTRILNVMAGIDELDTDNPYSDLNDDGMPDLAIGRLPAHSADELGTMLKRILAYEDSHDFGPWRARIDFVTGQGSQGYFDWIDSKIETVARHAVGWEMPPAFQASMTNAIWESPFCPDPRKFHNRCLERMNEGCLFWVFAGHGSPRTLQWAMFPDGGTPIFQCEDCAQIHCGSKPPIVLFFCCYTGALTNADGCICNDLIRAADGPVAVIGGSSETAPYGMAAFGRQAIRQYFEQRSETLGKWLLAAKRDTMGGYDLPIWSLVNAATVAMAPASFNPKAERLEHLQLFNLFGDPTMKLYHPKDVKLDVAKTGTIGGKISVQGECPIDGSATVELITPLDQLQIPEREAYDGSVKGRAQFDATYQAANHLSLASATIEVHGGRFSAELAVPKNAAGRCRVRVFVEGKNDCALGAADISVTDTDRASP